MNQGNHIVILSKSIQELCKVYGVTEVYSDGGLVGVRYRGKVLWYKHKDNIGYVAFGETACVMSNTLKVAV